MKNYIKKDLSLYILFEYLQNIQTNCYGLFSSDTTLNSLFCPLLAYVHKQISENLFGDILDQYVVTVCEKIKNVKETTE